MKMSVLPSLLCGFACAFVMPLIPVTHAQVTNASGSIVLPVLTYHYVESAEHATTRGAKLITSPTVFEKQLIALQERKYRTLFASDIPACFVSSMLPQHSIALTFDDGYEDFYWNVLPLLKKYQAKATLYMIAGFVGKPGYLTQAELQEITASGLVEIGAHTINHKNLTTLSSAAAETEVKGSKTSLEQMLGIPVTAFAYPFGGYSPRITSIVQQAGFTTAVTTERGWSQSPGRLFVIKRIPGLAFVGSRKWKAIGDTSPISRSSSSSSSLKPSHRRSSR